jgi:predicted naringenin-chalcone synthase
VTMILTQLNPMKQNLTIVDLNDNVAPIKPCILSIGLATPKFCYKQSEMSELAKNYYKNDRVEKIFLGSEIEQRYSVVDIHDPDILQKVSSFQKRNEIYEVEAVELAVQSSQNAISRWGGSVDNITHLLSVSTTGTKIPGIEFELVGRLGLSKSIQRVAVNYMGCFGSLPGLKTACAFASMNPKNRVLMVSTEICSTHFEDESTIENIVSAAIFADGSGAMIIGGGTFASFEKPIYQIERFGSLAIENSLDKMYWKITDKGWRLGLSRDIPSLIHDHISNFVDSLTDNKDCDFALHPGGKAILLSIENAVGIKREKSQASWNVMKKHGNMSSSSIIYVLQELLNHRQRETTCMLVFGPGLVIEGALLKNL